MGVIARVAKYTNEELSRIQEQYAELIEGSESEPHQADFEDEVRVEEDSAEEEASPS